MRARSRPVASAIVGSLLLGVVLAAAGCGEDSDAARPIFGDPERVNLQGYDGHAMEPFLTRDGRYLFFNNLNDPSENTNLHYAERIDDLTFQYRGEIEGVNTAALEGVPTMDRNGVFYFVSTRSYEQTLSTLYRGLYSNGRVSGVELVPGVSPLQMGRVNFDAEISPDGETLYSVDSRFANGAPQTADIVVAQRLGASFEPSSNSAAIMGHVNTGDLEYAACISADGLTLFFTRAQAGLLAGASIYMAERGDATQLFEPPVRLSALDGFVEGPTLSPDERSLYYHKKEGVRFVIYRATRR